LVKDFILRYGKVAKVFISEANAILLLYWAGLTLHAVRAPEVPIGLV
jgi:indole-3-glycerol phosphate synthase